MTYTYTWENPDHTTICREDSDGVKTYVPVDPGNREYQELLASGAAVADYIQPPAPPELTVSERLARAGLTLDDLKEALR